MKTIDEVINKLECYPVSPSTLPCSVSIVTVEDLVDALHYLKEFQGLSKMWNDKLDKEQENPPLDWETLKQMEGKPVWVEGEHGCIWNQKAWSLIRLDPENDDIVICISTDGNLHYEYAIGKEDYGTDWQAYRKER